MQNKYIATTGKGDREDIIQAIRRFCGSRMTESALKDVLTTLSSSPSIPSSISQISSAKERFSAARKQSVELLTKLISIRLAAIDIQPIKAKLVTGVPVKDRTFMFKTYTNCFQGSEAIKYMVTTGIAESIKHATLLGVLLLRAGEIRCITKSDRNFQSEDLYVFVEKSDAKGKLGVVVEH